MPRTDNSWPFSDPPDTEVITLSRILKGDAPLRLVTHDEDDGSWQFLDGEHVFEEDAAVVSLGFMAMLDPSILDLGDLPIGWRAYRDDANQPWRKDAEEPPDDHQ
jgi:hypothetical protein